MKEPRQRIDNPSPSYNFLLNLLLYILKEPRIVPSFLGMVYSPKEPAANFSILHLPGPTCFHAPLPRLLRRATHSAGALSRP